MKKLSIALLTLAASANAFAATTNPCSGAALDMSGLTEVTYTARNAACTFTIDATSANPSFVIRDFDITMSSGVAASVHQNSQVLAVGTGATKGRYVFTGHSSGGSVSSCNTTPYDTAADNPALNTADDLDITKVGGCTNGAAL